MMDIRKRIFILGVLGTTLTVAGGCGQNGKSHDEIVREDLLLIVETLGKPCGEVIEYELVNELEYEIHCESGDSYTLSVSDVGRVGLD